MNLIICTTPLQVLIAEKIIEKNKNVDFYFILLSAVNNGKYKYYYQRISLKTINSLYLDISNSFHAKGVKKLSELFKRKEHLKHSLLIDSFNTVFVANIENIDVQLILSCINFKMLNTFDDGTSNIMKNSFLYQKSYFNLKNTIGRKLLGIKYYIEHLRELTHLHYTLYINEENICKNQEIIYLIDKDTYIHVSDNTNFLEERTIFLSQPIYSSSCLNQQLFNRLYEKYNFDYYFPHPRENYEFNCSKKIETDLIFEDYICNLLRTEKNIKYTIYTYFSSAILNIKDISSAVSVIAIRPNNEKFDEYLDIYTFFEKKGIIVECVNLGS